ncbi:GNAT family N-acetyltransferase [Streptomyces sp. NPDC058045]|uniref:GNAT family N-acetyltransferase n=1 Tax=Streptomyces sp. NPDC058045 TaxID=3346311 RepID=UPI0036EB3DA1
MAPTDPTALTLRPLTGPDELALFSRLPYVLNDELADDLDAGRRRPEWMWVALRGDRLLARVAWWSRTPGTDPYLLDIFDLADDAPDPDLPDIALRLLRTATAAVVPNGTRPPRYCGFLPAGSSGDQAARRAAETRTAILERAGARLFVERLNLEWRPGAPVPDPGPRLTFRPLTDTGELITLMTAVLEGTLDAHSREALTRLPAREVATEHYERELSRYTTPRDWWRTATLPDGEPVGFVLPAHNAYGPIIAYLAVLPAHRGHGHIHDILAEGTRTLATHDAPRIRATTDLTNTPMAQAFHRAGYHESGRQLDMTWG